MCPRSSITTPVPSRLGPRVALLRALGMAFILTRTTAASISSASLSSSAWVCWDFWACGLSFGSWATAPPNPSSKAVNAERMRLVVIVLPPELALSIVILNGGDFHFGNTQLCSGSSGVRPARLSFRDEHLAQHEPVPQSRAHARSSPHAHFPHRGARDGRRVRPRVRGSPAALARRLYRLWRLFDPGGLARRPLEPAGHDGSVLLRHRHREHPHGRHHRPGADRP